MFIDDKGYHEPAKNGLLLSVFGQDLYHHEIDQSETLTETRGKPMTTVVDPKEVTKFNQIARSYWDPEGPMRAIHQINPLRIDFTESFYPCLL